MLCAMEPWSQAKGTHTLYQTCESREHGEIDRIGRNITILNVCVRFSHMKQQLCKGL